MDIAARIQPHMDVVGPDGAAIGKVDGIEGDRIKLTRKDSPDGQHHYVPILAVQNVDEQVHLGEDAGALTD